MVNQGSFNLEDSWTALLTVEKTFLTVKTPASLPRYRSEPDLAQFWRKDEAFESQFVMINVLKGKKCNADDSWSLTSIEPRTSRCFDAATITTDDPDSESESSELMSSQSGHSDVKEANATLWADVSEESQSHEHTETRKTRKKTGRRIRLCKSKRARCQKIMSKLKEEVEASPESFNTNHVDLPRHLVFNDVLKDRFTAAALLVHQSHVLHVREENIVGSGVAAHFDR
jgi:hypothetical protein